MGMIKITVAGSFQEKCGEHKFSAVEFGHAQAVADALHYLTELLPWAIAHDHELHDNGQKPKAQFGGKLNC